MYDFSRPSHLLESDFLVQLNFVWLAFLVLKVFFFWFGDLDFAVLINFCSEHFSHLNYLMDLTNIVQGNGKYVSAFKMDLT